MSIETSPPADLLVDRPALDYLLRPRRMGFVGASDKNLFSRRAFAQHQRIAAPDRVVLVNPRTPIVHGVATVQSCRDIAGGIDCAFLLTGARDTPAALEDAASAGARAAVVLGQGWAEEGSEGRSRQAELTARAAELGVILLGPNNLGFANMWDGVAACGLGLDMPTEPGAFALVAQSGAVASSLVGYAGRHDMRFSFVVTTGNEAMTSVADVVAYLVEDKHTRAIGVFAETISKPDLFRRASARAAELGKAIVILKAGSSELAAATASAHTGALVGDDRVIDAVLRQDGVIRVRSVEDLICTGALCAEIGPVSAGGVGVLSVSGGACDLIADRGHDVGLNLPALSDPTKAALARILPPYGHPQNPLDVTGGALADPEVWRAGIEAMSTESAIGLIGVVTSLPREGEPQRDDTFNAVGQTLRATGLPGVIFPQIEQEQSAYVRQVRRTSGVPMVFPSLDRFTFAAAALTRWSTWLGIRTQGLSADARPGDVPSVPTSTTGAPLNENQARELLEAASIPTVPAALATTAQAAALAAERFEGPVAVKMCSAEVAHKTEFGGVKLDVLGRDAVVRSFEDLTKSARQAGVHLDGVLVSPMRTGGIELLVGVTRDEDWGQILAVAFGGALVELLDDSVLRALPVDRAEVRTMLTELRGYRLLSGFRGSRPADIDALVEVIVRIADLAAATPGIESLEVNPLLVDGDQIEALDALVTFPTPHATSDRKELRTK